MRKIIVEFSKAQWNATMRAILSKQANLFLDTREMQVLENAEIAMRNGKGKTSIPCKGAKHV